MSPEWNRARLRDCRTASHSCQCRIAAIHRSGVIYEVTVRRAARLVVVFEGYGVPAARIVQTGGNWAEWPLLHADRVPKLEESEPEIWALTHDLRVVNLSAGADAPIASQDGLVALGPAGLVVTDSSGAISWLAVPVQ